MTAHAALDLSVDLAPHAKRGLRLRNPVMTASGTFSNGLELSKVFDIQRLGAMVSKGLTLTPRPGNPTPRVVETPAGMLNSIGFQNLGLRRLARDVCPVWATWDLPVVVNILGETVAEFTTLARELDGVPGVAALEVNVSCPNLDVGGMEFGQDARLTAEVTQAVVQATTPAGDCEVDAQRHGYHRPGARGAGCRGGRALCGQLVSGDGL